MASDQIRPLPLQTMILRNLVLLILLPLLAAYPAFVSYHQAYSTDDNLKIFGLLTLCNCICYLSKLEVPIRNDLDNKLLHTSQSI